MRCGFLPFGENAEEQYEIEDEIKNKTLDIPQYVDTKIKQVIESLLNKDPAERAQGGFEKIKNMKWFKGFDWVKN